RLGLLWCWKRDSPTRRPLFPLNAGTAEPFRVSPPEAVAYHLELSINTDVQVFCAKLTRPPRCLSSGGPVTQNLRTRRHLLSTPAYRQVMAQRFQIWYEVTGTATA